MPDVGFRLAEAALGGVTLDPALHLRLDRVEATPRAAPAVPALLHRLVEAGVVEIAEQVPVPLDAAVRVDRSGELCGARLDEHDGLLRMAGPSLKAARR